jgi:hypothetical protein
MLGMAKENPRGMISDRVWVQLKEALEEAKHSRAGAPPELSDRDFLEAVLYLNHVAVRGGIYHRSSATGTRSTCDFGAGKSGSMAAALAAPSVRMLRPGSSSVGWNSTTVGAHQHAAGAQKNGGD